MRGPAVGWIATLLTARDVPIIQVAARWKSIEVTRVRSFVISL